jgi:hypothetical protein
MKTTVKRAGKQARGKSLKEMARDTKKMIFGGLKKKKAKKK